MELPRESKELIESPVKARWGYPTGERPGVSLYISDPWAGDENAAWFGGIFNVKKGLGTFLQLGVKEEVRDRGLATRLVSALAHIALLHGVTKLAGLVQSQHTLKIFGELFGEENIEYVDADPQDGRELPLPISTKEAIALLERAERKENDLENREIGFDAQVDISQASISQLELPLELNKPLI